MFSKASYFFGESLKEVKIPLLFNKRGHAGFIAMPIWDLPFHALRFCPAKTRFFKPICNGMVFHFVIQKERTVLYDYATRF